ncbi:ABC transporter substrate-binding protein [Shewanella corallii]|uniref:ABC transporter substrate-binding protein n=1 Tax=Shewanella corallii TaxID=560080 RepID=A0ABT0NBL0_9GAMM|nr:ABC transporter substrate-binding protein [Shewanella corallii]MCL2915814.1 ABC transporter substrate-binding protein [Shewanella corallii]
MRLPTPRWRHAITALCLTALATGCTPEQVPAGLVYCSEGNPESFNPQLSTSGTTLDATSNQIYSRLVDYAADKGAIVPALATNWHISEDGLVYNFTLRQGVQFHNSERFTPSRTFNADDVIFSFQRIVDDKHPFHAISKTGYPFFDSIGFASQITSIDKISDYEVAFTLHDPDASFLSNLSSAFAVVLSKEYGDQLLLAGRPELIDQYPIGTGPFSMTEYVKNDHIRYHRHPEFWGKSPQLEMLVFDITPKSGTRLVKLITGDCSVSALPKAGELPVIELHETLQVQSDPAMNVAYWSFNTQKPPFDNVDVRQALAMAIDKQNILRAVYRDTGVEARGILPPSSWAYNDSLKAQEYDPKQAMKLLEQAGIKNLELDIWAMPVGRSYNPNSLKTAELIQSDLANIGVKVNIVSYGWSVFTQKLNQSDYDTVLIGWNADNSDPDNFFTPLLSCGSIASGTNRSRWCNTEFEEIISQARQNTSKLERATLYQEAEGIMKSQMPLVSLAHAQKQTLKRDNVMQLPVSPFGGIAFADLTIKIAETAN